MFGLNLTARCLILGQGRKMESVIQSLQGDWLALKEPSKLFKKHTTKILILPRLGPQEPGTSSSTWWKWSCILVFLSGGRNKPLTGHEYIWTLREFSGLAYLEECPHPQNKGIHVLDVYNSEGFVLKQRHSSATWIGNFTFRNERARKMNVT